MMKALDRLCSRLRLIIHWITMLQYVFIFQKTITLPICKASIYNTYKVENTNYYKQGIHGLQNSRLKRLIRDVTMQYYGKLKVILIGRRCLNPMLSKNLHEAVLPITILTNGTTPDCATRLVRYCVTSDAYPRRRCSSNVCSRLIPLGGWHIIHDTSSSFSFKKTPAEGSSSISLPMYSTLVDAL